MIAKHTLTVNSVKLCSLVEYLLSGKGMFCREALIQELRGNMYGLLDAFKGDFSQQAEHYERRMRQLQTNLQGQLTTVSLPQTYRHSGAWRLMISQSFACGLHCHTAVAAALKESLCCQILESLLSNSVRQF